MHRIYHTIPSSIALLGTGVALVFFMALSIYPKSAQSESSTPITGYAWSDNVGWISFSCTDAGTCGTSNYGVMIAADGTMSGYAWSDNIGWVSANASDVSGCPSAPCTPKINPVDGTVTGWLRAIWNGSGWDGWISLGGAGYGPVLGTDGVFSGFAWGSDVVGWVDMSTGLSSVVTQYRPCTPNSNVCIDGVTLRHYNADCTYTDAVCQLAGYGYGCVNTACLVPPSPGPGGSVPGGIQTTPRLVRAGETVQVSWDIENADPASCTVTGTNGDTWNGQAVGSQTSQPIQEQTVYSLHCNGDPVDILTFDARAVVDIVPTFEEI